MKKTLVIIVAVCIVVGGGIGGFFLWRQRMSIPSVPQLSQTAPQEEELALWEDQAGFSFKYPKSLSFNKHDEDTTHYAHIEFTSSTHSGRLIVWAKDTSSVDISAWIAQTIEVKNAVSVDTTLGGISAKKIIITTPAKKLITATVADQIIFSVEAEPVEGDEYWQHVYTTITNSFTFSDTATATSPQDTVEDTATSVDEEEVIE